jgi:ribosomal protein L11 methyltransferase
VIRLGVRVRRADAELALAQLLVLAPSGFEECDIDDQTVEYAIYGASGELPDVGQLRATVGDAFVEVDSRELADDWADRWREFHRPIAVHAPAGGAVGLYVRPPWEPPPGAGAQLLDIAIDPAQAFGTGAHATTRMCLALLLALHRDGLAGGPLLDVGCGSGVLAIAAARLGFAPVRGLDHEAESVLATADNAAANGVEVEVARWDLLRDPLPPVGALTVTANLLAPLLDALAAAIGRRGELPAQLIASGLLVSELDAAAGAFAAAGMREHARLTEGEWGALAFAPDI